MENENNSPTMVDEESLPIAKVENTTLATLSFSVKELEEKAKLFLRIRKVILTVTVPHDWVIYGGESVRLTRHGFNKVSAILGLGRRITDITRRELQNDRGNYYSYTAQGYITFNGVRYDQIGTCDSQDPFFSMANGRERDNSEICEGDIEKTAVTNMYGRAIEDLAGGGFTKAEVEEVIDSLDKATNINYGDSSGADKETGADAKLRQDLMEMILEMNSKNTSEAGSYCKEISAFKLSKGPDKGKEIPGDPDFPKWKITRVKANEKRIREDYANFKKEA